MDKLKRYNQKLLAILGTATLVVIVGIIGVGLVAGTITLISTFENDNEGIQIRNDEQSDKDILLRTQGITFQEPIQLDTTKSNFLIPVGQVNLQTPKNIENARVNISKDYYASPYRRLYNNFILYNSKTGKRTHIFQKKIAVTDWSFFKIEETELLLFKGTTKDYNKDNLFNENDFQSLFVYSLQDNKLTKHEFKNKTVLSFEFMNKTNHIYIKLGIDKNKDFNFDPETEPQEIYLLNTETNKIENLISAEMQNNIQKIIDK